jgi:hypothetical protein
LPTEKAASIGALLTDNLIVFNVSWVIYKQCTALAASDVLGLVKRLGDQHTKHTEIFPVISPEKTMSILFYH